MNALVKRSVHARCIYITSSNARTTQVPQEHAVAYISILHCKENPIYVFLFWELPGLSPNFHIHVSVSDLYIPRISLHILLQPNRKTDPVNI